VRRYGTKKNMTGATPNLEKLAVGGKERHLNLDNPNGDPIPGTTLAGATKTLKKALGDLPQLATDAEHPAGPTHMLTRRAAAGPNFTLDLPEIEETGVELRPHLADHAHRFTGPRPVPRAAVMAAAQPLSQILVPLQLDLLTAVDDKDFIKGLKAEKNLPVPFRDELLRLL
jgi:hypothetical protein